MPVGRGGCAHRGNDCLGAALMAALAPSPGGDAHSRGRVNCIHVAASGHRRAEFQLWRQKSPPFRNHRFLADTVPFPHARQPRISYLESHQNSNQKGRISKKLALTTAVAGRRERPVPVDRSPLTRHPPTPVGSKRTANSAAFEMATAKSQPLIEANAEIASHEKLRARLRRRLCRCTVVSRCLILWAWSWAQRSDAGGGRKLHRNGVAGAGARRLMTFSVFRTFKQSRSCAAGN